MHVLLLLLLLSLRVSSEESAQPGGSGPPVVDDGKTDSGLSGTRTEHRTPDGSLITVTNFRGNLPLSAVQPSFYNPYGAFPPFPFFGYSQQQQPRT